MRHAYVILAHNEPQILATLVRMIDDERNDIFIHVDAKADLSQFADVSAIKSRLIWTPRVKVYWGGPSLIRAEMTAIKCARAHGEYARYHLISGVDLPIKSQDYIHDFCDVKNPDKEFVGFDRRADSNPEVRDQYKYYLLLDDYTRLANAFLRKVCSFVRRSFVALQKITHFDRRPAFEVKKGTNWVSLTGSMVDWLLSSDGGLPIYRFLLHSHCPDEKLMQTAVWNSPFRGNIFDLNDEMQGCMREIDWARGTPYVWQVEDMPSLLKSKGLFARKFSSRYMDAVAAIEKGVCG